MEAKKHYWGAGTTTALIALPALYVLSVGPAVLALERSTGSINPHLETCIERFYAPLGLVYEYTPLKEPLDWYVSFWTSTSP